jgi:hypothetical protein
MTRSEIISKVRDIRDDFRQKADYHLDGGRKHTAADLYRVENGLQRLIDEIVKDWSRA